MDREIIINRGSSRIMLIALSILYIREILYIGIEIFNT